MVTIVLMLSRAIAAMIMAVALMRAESRTALSGLLMACFSLYVTSRNALRYKVVLMPIQRQHSIEISQCPHLRAAQYHVVVTATTSTHYLEWGPLLLHWRKYTLKVFLERSVICPSSSPCLTPHNRVLYKKLSHLGMLHSSRLSLHNNRHGIFIFP